MFGSLAGWLVGMSVDIKGALCKVWNCEVGAVAGRKGVAGYLWSSYIARESAIIMA